MTEVESTIYLIRHGARYDFANPSWKEKILSAGGLPTDPPLSSIGHEQARERATKLENVRVDKILVSPYLRTIQTAVPFSEKLDVPICIENGLAEGPHVPGVLPSAKERYIYFPQIDVAYESILEPIASPNDLHHQLKKPQEPFPVEYFKRIRNFTKLLEKEYLGKSIMCFSHAASLAMVAALLNCNIEDIPGDNHCKGSERTDLFAPLGVYKLIRKASQKWTLVMNGSSSDDLSSNDATTFPWGYDQLLSSKNYCCDGLLIWKEVMESKGT